MSKKNVLFFKVLELLKEKGLTQTELAKRSCLTQPSLSRILAGKYEVKVANLEKIAKVLNVPVSYLLEDKINLNKSTNDDIKKMIEENNKYFISEINSLKNKIKMLEKKIDSKK